MAISQKYLNEGERVLVHTRTHPKQLIGPALVLVVTVALVWWLASVSPEGTAGTVFGAAVGVVAGAVVVWWVLRPFVKWLTTTYTFTDRRFFTRSGFIAKEGRTIPLNRISGIDFDIDLTDRIFGCGTLVITDASAEGRVLVHDIPRVEKVQLLVADELHRAISSENQPPGARGDDGA